MRKVTPASSGPATPSPTGMGGPNRRAFVKAAAGASLLTMVPTVHAAGSDTLKVALIGCGGRGTGAAENALSADPNTKLVAMADAFGNQIESSLAALQQSPVASRVEVPSDRRFVGFDAYKAAIDEADVVILASTPRFRPDHMAYAAERGKHAFVEKPIATDAPGVRKFLDACKVAQSKNLSVVAGLCWRYYKPRVEGMAKVHDGAIGDIVAIETTYNSGGVWEPRVTRDQCQSEMEYQMRNWYYYDWLSGDHIVEQAIHGIDTMAWAMKDVPPIRCFGVGGRQSRTDARYGNIYDHFSLVYEYENGVRGYHQCRHWRQTANQVKDYVFGSQGSFDVFAPRITGTNAWRNRDRGQHNMYQHEHEVLFNSIREGRPKADGDFVAKSTLLAIMGRMAAYTGQVITWDMAMNSTEDLGPATLAWTDEVPNRPVPIPGVTKFA